jgi:hypothetical protein
MGAELIKVYKEQLPALRLIGKRYFDEDRINGSFANKWEEWFRNGWFEELENHGPLEGTEDTYLGAMRMVANAEGHNFEYWICMFFPENSEVPEGYDFADIPQGNIAVGWIYGNEMNGEIYGDEPLKLCLSKFKEEGWQLHDDPWYFERYSCPRFTTPDEKGNVILDYCVYIK